MERGYETHWEEVQRLAEELAKRDARIHDLEKVMEVIEEVHSQVGDDLCWMDIDKIFLAAGLPVPDRSVGDKFAMLKNCARYIDTMCKGGSWTTYEQLEQENATLRGQVTWLKGENESLLKGYPPPDQALLELLTQENTDLKTALHEAEEKLKWLRNAIDLQPALVQDDIADTMARSATSGVPKRLIDSLDKRMAYACEVCGNYPDEDGMLEHGRGCYKLGADGGGSEYVGEAIGEDSHYGSTNSCPNCGKDTPHLCHDSGHERDGSQDWRECKVCKWRWSGLTGKYRAPSGGRDEMSVGIQPGTSRHHQE